MALGNVGGLYGILCVIGGLIVKLFDAFTGSGLEWFVMSKLFVFEKRGFPLLNLHKETPMDLVKAKLKSHKPALFPLFGSIICCTK